MTSAVFPQVESHEFDDDVNELLFHGMHRRESWLAPEQTQHGIIQYLFHFGSNV
jgi:hypothetical protein